MGVIVREWDKVVKETYSMDWHRHMAEWTGRTDRMPASMLSLCWRKRCPCDVRG